MKKIADNIEIWTADTYNIDALYNIKYLWKDEEDTDVQFMPRVNNYYRINTVDSPYKCVLKFSCWWRHWTILSYEWKNYIGWVNLLRFRLYTWEVNAIEAMKFLNNHLTRDVFASGNYYTIYVYPFLK